MPKIEVAELGAPGRRLRVEAGKARISSRGESTLETDAMLDRTTLRLALGAGAVALMAATQACAHASLIRSDPPANATVDAPKSITLTFDEDITPAFSGFDVKRGDGAKMAFKTTISKDHRTVTGVPGGRLAVGAYRVVWRAAAADDGHRSTGTLAFTVK